MWEIYARWRMRDRSTGPWDEVVMQDGQGGTLRLVIHHGRRGLWSWEWTQMLLGHATRMISEQAWRCRDDCIQSLQVELIRLGQGSLAADVQRWEEEDDGGS